MELLTEREVLRLKAVQKKFENENRAGPLALMKRIGRGNPVLGKRYDETPDQYRDRLIAMMAEGA